MSGERSNIPMCSGRPAMKVTGRRAGNQPEAVRTSVVSTGRRAVPSAPSCLWGKFCSGRADNQPGAARSTVSKGTESSVPRDFLRPANERGNRRRTDNQPGAVRQSVDSAGRCAVPSAPSCLWGKFCSGRTDNQPGAARTTVSKSAESSVPRDFLRPANERVNRRRTDNQPGAVRQSVWIDDAVCCPERSASSEKSPNPGPRARTPGVTVAFWTAASARIGGVNNIAVVGCGVGESD